MREVFRGSRYGTCHLINNDLIFRHYQIEGEDYDYYELWQMNGTGKAIFLEGYHHAVWRSDNTDIWKRSETDIRSLNPDKSKGAQASEAEGWVTDLESRIVRHRYIPFVIYEKYPDDPWDIGVLAKNNKSTGSAKIRIRQGPSNKSKIIETKRVGTYVKILAEENGYYKIRIGKKEGYVQKEYLIPVTWQEK